MENQKNCDEKMKMAKQILQHNLIFLCRRARIFYALTNHTEIVAVIDRVEKMADDQCPFFSMEGLLFEYEQTDFLLNSAETRNFLVNLMSQYVEKARTLIEKQ